MTVPLQLSPDRVFDLAVGVFLSNSLVLGIAVGLVSLGLVAVLEDRDVGPSLSMIVSGGVIVAVATSYLLPRATLQSVGVPTALLTYDPQVLLAMGTLLLVTIWVVQVRIVGSRSTASSTAAGVGNQFERTVAEWSTVGRILTVSVAGATFAVASESGTLLGGIGEYLAEAPLSAVSFAISGLGYVALGGSLPILESVPILGQLGPGGWALATLTLVGLGLAVKNQ